MKLTFRCLPQSRNVFWGEFVGRQEFAQALKIHFEPTRMELYTRHTGGTLHCKLWNPRFAIIEMYIPFYTRSCCLEIAGC